MSFYKTFTTKDTIASINDSIRLVSKPFIYSIFKLLYYLNFSFQLIYLLPNYEVDRNYQIFHYIYQYQNFLNHRLYSLSRKRKSLYELIVNTSYHSLLSHQLLLQTWFIMLVKTFSEEKCAKL